MIDQLPVPGYVAFHLVFVLPAVAVLGAVVHRRSSSDTIAGIGLLAALALVYTVPWDNYLVARGVWQYSTGTVTARIGHTPVGEYAFIVLQPVLTGLWLHALGPAIDDELSVAWPIRAAGVAFWLAVATAGGLLLTTGAGYYLGAILAWTAPVLAFQWGVGGPALLRHRRLVALAVLVPTAYLWIADRLAIGVGLWVLSPAFTTGLAVPVLGLPIEEAVFFLLTNLLVVQGIVLFHWVLGVVAADTGTEELDALVPVGVLARWR